MFVLLSSLATYAYGKDVIIVNVGESNTDVRVLFKNELVKQALEITKPTYGDYTIVENTERMNISRAFRELESGKDLSLTFAHTRPEFERRALAVRVPLRQGLSSYRLLLTKKGNEAKFANVKTTEDLKSLTVGLSDNWATYQIMQNYGFTIVDAPNYSTMLHMLEFERFDYIPRAVNEVYDEIKFYKPKKEGLAIVPGIALYIPAASYMFVSPNQPRIYQRLNSGIHAMNANGELAALSDKYHRKFVQQAALQDRRIITITTPELSILAPLPELLTTCDCPM
jgi:ABC-type amino acid transport substrate-binding protein